MNLQSSGTREQAEALKKSLAVELPLSLFWPVMLGPEHRWYLPYWYPISGEGVYISWIPETHPRDYYPWEDSNVWLYQDVIYMMDGRYGEDEEQRGIVAYVKELRERPGG